MQFAQNFKRALQKPKGHRIIKTIIQPLGKETTAMNRTTVAVSMPVVSFACAMQLGFVAAARFFMFFFGFFFTGTYGKSAQPGISR